MSKRRPKTSLVNLLRNKKTAIAAAVCVVVAMGAYVGVHMYNSHAEDTQIGQMRGVINDISEIKEEERCKAYHGYRSRGTWFCRESFCLS